MYKRSIGFLAASALAAVIAQGCSSSTSSSSDGGPGTVTHIDAMSVVVVPEDGGAGEAGSSLCAGPSDGTTGKPCTTDSDCVTASGPGINKCSIDYPQIITNVTVQLLPSPTCMLPLPTSGTGIGNCDPAPPSDPSGMLIHYCDGPDDPTSPGVCVPGTNPPASCAGTCLQQCTFPLDGSAQTGCIGKDTCFLFAFNVDTTTDAVTGVGYCQGSCQADGDCSGLGAGYVCQTDIGLCTKKLVTRTKQPGAACSAVPNTVAGNDSATGACNCLTDTTTNTGYCAVACIVGGDPCPTGSICDNELPNAVQLPDGSVVTVTKENPGTPGSCMPVCSLTASADSGAGGTVDSGLSSADSGGGSPGCPAASTCQDVTPVGPDCVP